MPKNISSYVLNSKSNKILSKYEMTNRGFLFVQSLSFFKTDLGKIFQPITSEFQQHLEDDPKISEPEEYIQLVLDLDKKLDKYIQSQPNKCINTYNIFPRNRMKNLRILYSLLSFICHKYVWCLGEDNPKTEIPPNIGVFWSRTAYDAGGLKCVLNYTGCVLYNWQTNPNNSAGEKTRLKKKTYYEMEDISSIFTFTGTKDEDNFYKIMVIIEQYSRDIIKCCDLMKKYRRNPNIISIYHFPTNIIQDLSIILEKMVNALKLINDDPKYNIDPKLFYFNLRKYLKGFNDEDKFPNGLKIHKHFHSSFSGATGAQSPLIHYLDIIFDINHEFNNEHTKEIFSSSRELMLRNHHVFLIHERANKEFKEFFSYCSKHYNYNYKIYIDRCLSYIHSFRKIHMAIVHRYITKQCENDNTGTHGSDIKEFLKSTLDDTKQTTVFETVKNVSFENRTNEQKIDELSEKVVIKKNNTGEHEKEKLVIHKETRFEKIYRKGKKMLKQNNLIKIGCLFVVCIYVYYDR